MDRTTTAHTMQYYRELEKEAFGQIPGMTELLHAAPDTYDDIKTRFPDAAFTLMISDNLFCHDREQSEIHQRAYFAILNGENMADIRFRYNEDNKKYLQRHLWDD